MNNVSGIITGRLADQLAEVFGQIDGIKTPLSLEDRVLNAWMSGKNSKRISDECGITNGHVQKILIYARYRGDKRAIYRSGWSTGMVPGKLKIVLPSKDWSTLPPKKDTDDKQD